MAQKFPINGWLNLHKPLGMSSAKAVAIVKRHLHPQKIGHAGTLDPLASGVLPLALGEATKTIQFCMDTDKEYEFTVKWGFETTTCDAEGEITKTSDARPATAQIIEILPEFTGEISQAPPQYSAIKINGQRAYDLARAGEVVEMKQRKVIVHSLQLIEEGQEPGDRSEWMEKPLFTHSPSPLALSSFRVSCGKGTYVRSLARDIAIKLGTYGHVVALKRTKVGKFGIEDAILLEDIEKTVYKDAGSGVLLPVNSVLDDIQVLELTTEEATRLRHGQKIPAKILANIASFRGIFPSGNFIAKCNGTLVAICESGDGIIKPLRIFNL